MLQVTLMSSWDAGTGVDWRLTKASGCSRLCSRARSIGISRQCKTAASVRSMRLGAAVIWGQTPAHWPRGAPGCSPAQAGRPSEPQATQRTDCAPSAGAHARPASLQRPPPQHGAPSTPQPLTLPPRSAKIVASAVASAAAPGSEAAAARAVTATSRAAACVAIGSGWTGLQAGKERARVHPVMPTGARQRSNK